MTNVMTNAWKIAYEGVENFGGQVKEYFSEALKIAWNLLKKGEKKMKNRMKLVEEIPFGKATARITVDGSYHNETFHEFIAGGEVIVIPKIEIIHNGKVVGEGRHAYSMEYNLIYDRTYEKNNLDTSKTYTQIKGVGICEGKETAEKINSLIKSMGEEIEVHFKGEVKKKDKKDEVERAKKVIESAKKEGIENLKTEKEVQEWRKNYNNVVNEGGEGYVPQLISKERYESALQVLENER